MAFCTRHVNFHARDLEIDIGFPCFLRPRRIYDGSLGLPHMPSFPIFWNDWIIKKTAIQKISRGKIESRYLKRMNKTFTLNKQMADGTEVKSFQNF